ncbi:MAG: hypothetical protein AB1705_23460 [Verrucomicrobiota bacterium]
MICVCDHFEPFHAANKPEAMARMASWKDRFPKLIADFSDADGVHPRHTFFYPVEQYDSDILGELSELCRLSGGETEIHLHHDRDSETGLREKLERGKGDLGRHGLLCRDDAGTVRFGFVHGDWALDDSHPSGRHCGVRNELSILQAAGCYADFTMPSAPNPTQTRTVNSLYYAQDTPGAKSHDHGVPVRVENGTAANPRPGAGELLLIQGPLGLNWRRRKLGVLPRIENGDLTGANPPRPDRLQCWLELGIHVQGRPEWVFIKLHTHGAIPQNSSMLLGEPMRRFHEHATQQLVERNGYRLHYVSAREMTNILHAAEDGRIGNAGQYRDYRYKLRSQLSA